MKLVHDQEEITKEDAQFSFGKIKQFFKQFYKKQIIFRSIVERDWWTLRFVFGVVHCKFGQDRHLFSHYKLSFTEKMIPKKIAWSRIEGH